MLLNEEDFNYGERTHLAMTLLEHIGHRQSGDTFAGVWKRFHDAADAVHGNPAAPLPNPILLNTDCAGQLQNGWIAALRTEKQVTNRIMLHNVTLPILLSFEYEQGVGDDDHKWQTTLTSYHFFERLVPSGIHSCRSHVNGAVYGWVVN